MTKIITDNSKVNTNLLKENARLKKQSQKIKIELNDWIYNCSDGCCTNYGTTTKVNGVEMPLINQDAGTILKMVLEHLGYEVELITTYNDE